MNLIYTQAEMDEKNARTQELENALRDLYDECCKAGHNTDRDYAWPTVMSRAASALDGGSEHGT